MKKAYSLSGLIFITLFIVVWLANYLSGGTIIITSNKNSTIAIQKTSGGKPFTKIGIGSLSATIKHGQYIATVKNGTQASVQFIDFNNGHKTLKYTITSTVLKYVEPVTYQNSQNLEASSNKLLYLNASSKKLYEIDAQNNLINVNSTQQFQSIKWADASFGVGQDINGHLYTLNGGAISPLAVPFTYNRAEAGFDVTQSKEIYLSHGADVYASSQNGIFKKIYTAKYDGLALAGSANHVAVACKAEDTGDCNQNPELITISSAGKINAEKNTVIASGRVGAFHWSPNGQYLAVPGDSGLGIYDNVMHQIGSISTLDNSLINNARWLDNSTLFYSINDQLWTYNLNNQRADLVTVTSLGETIEDLAISDDKSYIYISTATVSGANQAIKRIGLQGQNVVDNIYKLKDIVPRPLDEFSLDLVNFKTPLTILVQPYPDSAVSAQLDLQAAQVKLQQAGIDLNKLQLKISP
jgi:hypothetical protein